MIRIKTLPQSQTNGYILTAKIESNLEVLAPIWPVNADIWICQMEKDKEHD